ncbi:hypothetical protein ACYULU_13310 [Breznakiellaceae bacterium SP9]
MIAELVFKQSAFSHGVTETDILKAMDEYLYDGPMDDDVNKENRINVFHAMAARKALMALLNR